MKSNFIKVYPNKFKKQETVTQRRPYKHKNKKTGQAIVSFTLCMRSDSLISNHREQLEYITETKHGQKNPPPMKII